MARRVPNPADAADISQQTLLLACTKLQTFRGERILAWLYAIAHHVIIDYYRSRNRFHFVALTPDSEADSEVALRTPIDSVIANYEFRQRLTAWRKDVAGELHLEHQVAVLLADVYGYQDKDSAAMLHMSVPSFKLLLHEARTRLKTVSASPSAGRATVAGRGPAKSASHMQRYRVGVSCRVKREDLRALQIKLIDGLSESTLPALLLVAAMNDLTPVTQALVMITSNTPMF